MLSEVGAQRRPRPPDTLEETARPLALILLVARAARNAPGSPMRSIIPRLIATSASRGSAPVPSTTRPPAIMTSKVAPSLVASRRHPLVATAGSRAMPAAPERAATLRYLFRRGSTEVDCHRWD